MLFALVKILPYVLCFVAGYMIRLIHARMLAVRDAKIIKLAHKTKQRELLDSTPTTELVKLLAERMDHRGDFK